MYILPDISWPKLDIHVIIIRNMWGLNPKVFILINFGLMYVTLILRTTIVHKMTVVLMNIEDYIIIVVNNIAMGIIIDNNFRVK